MRGSPVRVHYLLMDAFRRASAVLFFGLGVLVLVLILALKQEMVGVWATTLLNVLDLPLLLFGCLYGGLSLTGSMTKGKLTPLLIIVGIILGALFLIFLWFNFSFPFAEPL